MEALEEVVSVEVEEAADMALEEEDMAAAADMAVDHHANGKYQKSFVINCTDKQMLHRIL